MPYLEKDHSHTCNKVYEPYLKPPPILLHGVARPVRCSGDHGSIGHRNLYKKQARTMQGIKALHIRYLWVSLMASAGKSGKRFPLEGK
jgi:hypothetical protein